MKLYLHDAMEWVFPDRITEHILTEESPVLDIARGACASIVLIATEAAPGAKLTLATDIPNCRLFEMVDVCVNRNTCENGFAANGTPDRPISKSVVRVAPYRVYDALKPVEDGTVTANASGNAAVYVQFFAKDSMQPGSYPVTLNVSDGAAQIQKSFLVRVFDVKIPKNGRNSVYFTNWVDLRNFERTGKCTLFSPRFWSTVREHAAMMDHARQNTIIVPLGTFFDYKDGKFKLKERQMARYIQIFTAAGLYWIEGGHFGVRDGGWTATDFKVLHSGHSVKSMEGNRDIASIGRQLTAFIRKNHLQERWIQHVTDEPIPCNGDSYRIFAGLVRKYVPGVPLMDAMSDPEIAGPTDIWCPQVQVYQSRRAEFEAMREQGDHIWAYTCCMPGGAYLNRLVDEQLTRPLLLGWGCGSYGIEGFLHWGWNYCQTYKNTYPGNDTHVQNQFEETSPHEFGSSTNILPPGDTNVVYSGPDGTVWSSCRLEAHREGLEDWELIRMLRKKDAAKCAAITGKVFRAFDDYNTDPAAIRAARRELLSELGSGRF